jgi:hypothetical protein
MADASRLVLGGPQLLYVLLFSAICVAAAAANSKVLF